MKDPTIVLDRPATSSASLVNLGTTPRSKFILLQSMVSIVLSYELLFGSDLPLSLEARLTTALGLLAVVIGLRVLPARYLESTWFPVGLITFDTAATALVIYLSGNARSDLYITYFMIVLLAALGMSLTRMITLSAILCLGYAAVLYEEILETGLSSVSSMLGIPVLLMMTTFYAIAFRTIDPASQERGRLFENLDTLRNRIASLQAVHDDLERRVAALRTEATKSGKDSDRKGPDHPR